MTTGKESVALVKSEIRQRSQILGTQVINQNNATRLGVVSQVWVDLEQQQVLILGVREQAFSVSGGALTMELNQVAALGRDAILVSGEEVFADLELEGLSKVIGSDVVTETGTRLGKVKDFSFNSTSGVVSELILSSLGIPLIPGILISTFSMDADEILSASSNQIIVEDGAETRLTQLSKGLLESVGIGKPPWEAPTESPILPSAAESVETAEAEEYDQEYEEEYAEDDIYAEEEEAQPAPAPRSRAVEPEAEQNWQEEYEAEEAPEGGPIGGSQPLRQVEEEKLES
jgi:sporulation protein YlmC with PRC-barrel domain